MEFQSLTDLLLDYVKTYAVYLHKVKRVKVGMPLPYSNRSFESIQWNGCTINMSKTHVSEWSKACEKHARLIRLNSMSSSLNTVGQSSISQRNLTALSKAYLVQNAEKMNKTNNKSCPDNSKDESKAKIDSKKIVIENIVENTEIYDEVENKIVRELTEQDLNFLPTMPGSFSIKRENSKSILKAEKDIRSSLNSSQQSYQTNESTVVIKRKKIKSLRV